MSDRVELARPRFSPAVGKRFASRASDEAAKARASQTSVLELRGSPARGLPQHALEAAARAVVERDERPARGLISLREAFGAVLGREARAVLNPKEEILVTNGAMHAVDVLLRATLRPGDHVLMPAPTFLFDGVVRLAGGVPTYVMARETDGWEWDVDQLAAQVQPSTKLILLCNPVNPTGYVPSHDQLRALVELGERHGLVIVSDESYERFVYDPQLFSSLARFLPHPNIAVIRSMSKSYAMGSWRVGFLVGSSALITACNTILEWECINCAFVGQRVAEAVLRGSDVWLADVVPEFQANRDIAFHAVQSSLGISCTYPASGAFLLFNVEQFAKTAEIASDQLLECGVPTVPGTEFRAPGYVRLPFGGAKEVLDNLAARLSRWRDLALRAKS